MNEMFVSGCSMTQTVNSAGDNDFLRRLTYKPNTKLYWRGQGGMSSILVVEMDVPDSYNLDRMTRVSHQFLVPWNVQAEWKLMRKVAWVFECILKTERHEAREFFKLDGEQVDPPGHGLSDPYS